MLLELESLEKFYWWFCGDQVQNEVVFLFFTLKEVYFSFKNIYIVWLYGFI